VHSLELWRNFICGNETGSPGRAVSLHLARSGSQSEHRIRRILPACGACHIIKSDTRVLSSRGYTKQTFMYHETESKVRSYSILFAPLVLVWSTLEARNHKQSLKHCIYIYIYISLTLYIYIYIYI